MKKFRGTSILVSLKMKLGIPIKDEGKFTTDVLNYKMDCKWYWFRNNTLVIYVFNSGLVEDDVIIFSNIPNAKEFLETILITNLEEMPEHKHVSLHEVETRDVVDLLIKTINQK